MVDPAFWHKKKVFVTGHTGFKGSWLCLWLNHLGAKVTGYGLHPPTTPNLFEGCRLDQLLTSHIADIRDKDRLLQLLSDSDPDIVIHMAAQPLVLESYRNPVETYEVNVLGTVYLLDAVREAVEAGHRIRAVVNITTDKCYENKEWIWGYREEDALGGYDPYSNSKACSEMVTASYLNSFFLKQLNKQAGTGTAIATARAGNVIGGGDWATNRLVPDAMRSLLKGESIKVRSLHSTRPWQHVLEPLSGYLQLAQKLYEEGTAYAGAWNFGPNDDDVRSVEWLVASICEKWGQGARYETDGMSYPHEAHQLRLDSSKARRLLGWLPKWRIGTVISKVVDWTQAFAVNSWDQRELCMRQIIEYEQTGHGESG